MGHTRARQSALNLSGVISFEGIQSVGKIHQQQCSAGGRDGCLPSLSGGVEMEQHMAQQGWQRAARHPPRALLPAPLFLHTLGLPGLQGKTLL